MKLMRAPNALIGQHWVNLLTVAGIPCELHNRYLHGALGEIPAEQCSPELWLIDERDAVIARTIIERGMAGPESQSAPWRCRQCGEMLEPQFTTCWRCATARDPLDN
ncbi:DUF2007 domain-containing protein [Trinickia caryophylli]|uniref:putative signal transducing protein n=1 Tax=Trinickia caryophylli TaxID=28094 RepID=UPI000A15824A|nr:DUF2007 domain-containing protein [Trinickia caryophylli]PMS08791.1 hypothetical protein C0Z17_28395 [Trinickia caryophylli]TRX20245.1 DUF2007 domain-containing protein [Trinickia caryophylli]WQE13757.1 DUF2007 domain-containing protein [Trinickia caryophylli]